MWLSPLANHLWQSTVFVLFVWLLTRTLRKNRAAVRYWIWLAASVKFLIPFSLLVSAGHKVEWKPATRVAPAAVQTIQQTFEPVASNVTPRSSDWAGAALAAIWLFGTGAGVLYWVRCAGQLRRVRRSAKRLDLALPIPVLSSTERLEPGVLGIWDPVLMLPDGITDHLTPAQLEAVLRHELCHVGRRDNLTASIHMVVETVFWFHPLVWWIRARLVEEREKACDEEVLRAANDPETYAAGILNVCKFYVEPPIACVSGVTGADLKRRIEAIMANRSTLSLSVRRKFFLASTGIAALTIPILIGILRAQSDLPKFEVTSVKLADPNSRTVGISYSRGRGIQIQNMDLRQIIAFAYSVECGKSCADRVSGGPGWVNTQRFDVIGKGSSENDTVELSKATPEERKAYTDEVKGRVRSLLADRFKLVLRTEEKEQQIYALVIAKGGHKLEPSKAGDQNGGLSGGNGEMIGTNTTLNPLVLSLTGIVRRPVLDQTGLNGRFNYRLQYAPDFGGGGKGPDDAAGAPVTGPSIFTALQEQLGLKLESTRGKVEYLVIERVEKPEAN